MYNSYDKKVIKSGDEMLSEIGYKRKEDTEEARIYESEKYKLTIKKQYFTYKFIPVDGNEESKNYPSVPYRLLKAITQVINELIKEKYNKQDNTNNPRKTNNYNQQTKNINNQKTTNNINKNITQHKHEENGLCCLDCGNMFSTPGAIKKNNQLIKVCPKCKSNQIANFLGDYDNKIDIMK